MTKRSNGAAFQMLNNQFNLFQSQNKKKSIEKNIKNLVIIIENPIRNKDKE